MARNIQFRMSSPGARALLRSHDVREHLEGRADRVRQVVETSYSPQDNVLEVLADSYTGRNRSGATVIALGYAVMRIEATDRVLGSSIDAARG